MSFQSLVYQALFDVPWGPRTARRAFGYVESVRDKGMRFAAITMSSAQFRNSSLGPQLIEKSSLEVFAKAIHFFLESAPKAKIDESSDNNADGKISSHSTLGFTRKLLLVCPRDDRRKVIDLLVALKSVKYFTKSVTEITVDSSVEDEVVAGPVVTSDSSSASYYTSIAPHLRGFDHLRELIYGDSSEFAIQSLAPVLASLSSLETLAFLNVVSSSDSDDELGIDEGYMFGKWFAQLGSPPHLKNFVLDRSNGSFDDAVSFHNEENFEEGLRGFCRNTNKTLEKFCLNSMPTSISDDTLLRGFFDETDNKLLLLSTKLTSFSLTSCPGISGTSLVPLINNHLAQHNNLTELDFSHCTRLTEDDLIGITSKITSLVALTLASSMKINGSFLRKNAQNLGASLRELEMSNTYFSDETVGEDTFDHGNYSSLQSLRISDSSKLVGGKCLLGFIAPTSCRNKKLVINIAYCKKLDEGVKEQLTKAGVILSKEGEH